MADPGRFDERAATARRLGILAALLAIGLAGAALVPDAVHARAAGIAAVCLALWLSEAVPPFVPTLVMWAAIPIVLGGRDGGYALPAVLGWAAQPVLLLFLGGFALGAAATRHRIDAAVASWVVRASGGRRAALLALAIGGTALLSMWMSNIPATAMMLATLRPLFGARATNDAFRRMLLLGVALGANFGGMATPVGTGPNAIAIAAVSSTSRITFLQWMGVALPITIGMLAAAWLLLHAGAPRDGRIDVAAMPRVPLERRSRATVALFLVCVAAWLTEPLHGVPAGVVSLGVTAALFGSGLLAPGDFTRIDWSTLGLIAGGITLGALLEESGLVATFAHAVHWDALPPVVRDTAFVTAAALLSALMSNTGTAGMLIPLALALAPGPATAVLVAIGCSFGIPFVISTPPNAMAYGEGGLRAAHLLRVGLPLMLLGCVITGLTGRAALALFGVR